MTLFVSRDVAVSIAAMNRSRFRQLLWRQWHHKRDADWSIATACDVRSGEVVYSLPDVLRADTATRRSPMTRTIRDIPRRIA